jgi:hypothetical protein
MWEAAKTIGIFWVAMILGYGTMLAAFLLGKLALRLFRLVRKPH